jgi:DNA-binding IclR family transcriptional regulator
MTVPTESRPSVTSRVLAILAAFDEHRPRLTLTEIAAAADLPVSTAHRLVGELQAWDALERDLDGCYVIGQRLWKVGTLAPVARELRQASLPGMQDLYEATHENVQLAVREGVRALYVETIRGRASVPVLSRPGVPLPLHATGVGKVLLAWAPRDVLEPCLEDLKPVTRYTITERGRMLRELAGVRRLGYARTVEEMGYGTCALAVPVHDSGGNVVAALGLVTRTMRKDLVKFVPALQVASASITRRMAV